MSRRSDPFRRCVSAGLAVLTRALSVAVPVMERGTLVGAISVESQHDPSRCAHARDHRVCTQVSANLSLAPARSGHGLSHVLGRTPAPVAVSSLPSGSTREGPPPGAPPLA